MRGREKFSRSEKYLTSLTRVFKFLPRNVTIFLWRLVSKGNSHVTVGIRYCLARTLLKSCGRNVYFGPNLSISGWEFIIIGDNVSLHAGCTLMGEGSITINNDVSVAHSSSIISVNHTWDNKDLPIRDNPISYSPVLIESDVWVGCGARILAGTSIGSRCVIGANSVVTKDLSGGFLYAGTPATQLKSIVGKGSKRINPN